MVVCKTPNGTTKALFVSPHFWRRYCVWDTTYLAAAEDDLARRGQPVSDAAWAHLTPLLWEHIHLVGQYRFEEPVLHGRLRPLRASAAEEEVETDEEA